MNLPSNIGIIGVGLIGGSMAKALKMRVPGVRIASLARKCPDLEQAVSQNTVDRLFNTWEELIAFSDLIILAAPLSQLVELAEEIARRCPKEKKLLVVDVGSVKNTIVPVFEALTTENLEFFGTHPMAGKETWGFAHSDAKLFEGCHWILTPHAKNKSLKTVSNFVVMLGGKSIVMDPKKHDEQTALVSHLPALLSRALLQFVEETNPESLKIAGPGFQSMTRLARDNPQMYKEIAEMNREELCKQLSLLIEFIERDLP